MRAELGLEMVTGGVWKGGDGEMTRKEGKYGDMMEENREHTICSSIHN